MMEGDWIAMPGVPLIAAQNPEAVAEEGATGPTLPATVLALRRDDGADVR
jgi:hypothetical protein